MALLTADCPRCGTHKITFDVRSYVVVETTGSFANRLETYAVCRQCHVGTIFLLGIITLKERSYWNQMFSGSESLDPFVVVDRFVSLKDNANRAIPEHLPAELKDIFCEAATCQATECWNAAGCMFRLVVDKATAPLLPEKDAAGGPNSFQREKLGPRLLWLLDSGRLPRDLGELADSITKDGNDGAHIGNLTSNDAEDLYDFTFELLNRLISEPKRIELAKSRRDERRGKTGGDGSATPAT